MGTELNDEVRRLFEGRNFGHLATLMPDGGPQTTPVWLDVDDRYILVNSAEGRVKVKNVRRNPRVAISVLDHDNPYTTVSVWGRVVELTHQGADEHIDALAKKYLGQDTYPFRQATEQRVIMKIEPEKVSG